MTSDRSIGTGAAGDMVRTVLVTGGSNGIGRAIVERLASEGYVPINLDIVEPARQTPNEIFVQVDLCDHHALMRALDGLGEDTDILRIVNNAGVVKPALLEDTDIEDMRRVANLNIEVPTLLAQRFAGRMRQRKFGRIVNISSRASLGKVARTAYAASKAGILGMTRTWALELAGDGITVNAVAPGAIATELFAAANPDGAPRTRKILDSTPAGRFGRPDEVAHAVSFFLDDRAAFVTGQTVFVCGGLSVGFAD